MLHQLKQTYIKPHGQAGTRWRVIKKLHPIPTVDELKRIGYRAETGTKQDYSALSLSLPVSIPRWRSSESLPIPPQPPDPADADALLPSLDPLLPMLHLTSPHRPNPLSQIVLDTLPLNGPLPSDQSRSHHATAVNSLTGNTFRWEYTAFD